MHRSSLVVPLFAASLLLGLSACSKSGSAPGAPETASEKKAVAEEPAMAEPSAEPEAEKAKESKGAADELGPPGSQSPAPIDPGDIAQQAVGGSDARGNRIQTKTEIVAVGDAGSVGSTSVSNKGATESETEAETEAGDRDLPKPIYADKGKQCRKDFSVGDKVKAFKLTSAEGDKTIAPANYRGRVMLLNFWGTWCKPCLEELPEFDRLYRRYRNNGFTLVAVATDEDPKLVQEFVDKHKLIAKVALGGEKAAGEYNRPNFPFSFVVDGSGEIVAAFDFVDEACLGELEQIIRAELEKL